MRSRPSWYYVQSAVVPYRVSVGLLEVLLITSWSGKRWTIPKGVVELGMTASASAAKEAFEEAGVRGEVESVPLGSYEYGKWGGTCAVEVFAMSVREVLDVWPESNARRRRWLGIEEATVAVSLTELRDMLNILSDRLRGRNTSGG